jgi:serine/threonine-protein kinase
MKICSACRRCYEDTVLSCIEENHDSLIEARSGSREIISNYRLEFLLECDAVSETYAATNVLLNETCAVTIIDGNLTGIAPQLLREQFQNEARTAAAIEHPNVVRVYESGVLESSEFYVVTEFVEGRTLREYLNSADSASEKDAVIIARQTAEGLEAAHKAGVQHRNLNLTNIILTSSLENDLLVKIQNFDFGNVRQAAACSISDSESHRSWLQYSSPEQCAVQTTDARTDIYSLGVVLYEMLAGRPPFDAPDAAELIRQQINEQPPPVKISNFDIRALLTHTLMQALQKNPARRIQPANAFARQLRHIEQLVVRSPVPIPAQVFERISAPNAIHSSAPMLQNNAFTAKFDNSPLEETRLSVQETAEAAAANLAEAERFALLRDGTQEESIIENVSPVLPGMSFVERTNAVVFQSVSELDSAECMQVENVPSEREINHAEEDFDYVNFAPQPFRFKGESVFDASESEPEISPAAGIEGTPARPITVNSSPSRSTGHGLWQTMMLNRPILAGASLAALLVSAIVGLLLNEKFQYYDPQPPNASAPVQESAILPKLEEVTLTASTDTAITEESKTEESEMEESDVPYLEKYTPVKFEKPMSAPPLRESRNQPLKEKAINKTEAKQDMSSDKKLAPVENDKKLASIGKVNKTKAKENTPINKKPAPKKQIAVSTEVDIFMRPRKVEGGSPRRKN